MKIANIEIGPAHAPVVIAEIGINHEGSLETAKKMVDAAVGAGAQIVKHQTHIVDDEMSPEAKKVIPGNADVSIYEIMKRCALSEKDELALKEYVEAKGAVFISTPFSRAAANRLERMGVVSYKIGSGECNNYPLIEHIASFGKPMIVSTGMNSLESVRKTVAILEKHHVEYALLHCTNIYPTKPEQIRLGAMMELASNFSGVPFGLSDHSLNNNACLAAVALGASLLERHFTDSMYRPGPDIACSMDPKALSELIWSSREIALMRGGHKAALREEQVTIDFAYATVVATRDINKGEIFTRDNLWVKRPGTGELLAEHYDSCIGQIATRMIKSGEHLKRTDVVLEAE